MHPCGSQLWRLDHHREAGIDSHVVGLVYVAAAAPSVGHYEAEDEGKTPSELAKTKGAIVVTTDGFTFLNPPKFPDLFAPNLPRERAVFESHSQVLASAKVFHTLLTAAAWEAKPSWAIVAGDDKIINPEVEKMWYERAHSHVIVIDGVGHDVYESESKASCSSDRRSCNARSVERLRADLRGVMGKTEGDRRKPTCRYRSTS